jgi:hypothetical protein
MLNSCAPSAARAGEPEARARKTAARTGRDMKAPEVRKFGMVIPVGRAPGKAPVYASV